MRHGKHQVLSRHWLVPFFTENSATGGCHSISGVLGSDFRPRTRNVQAQRRTVKQCDCQSQHFKAILYRGNGGGKCVGFVRISSDSHEHRYILK